MFPYSFILLQDICSKFWPKSPVPRGTAGDSEIGHVEIKGKGSLSPLGVSVLSSLSTDSRLLPTLALSRQEMMSSSEATVGFKAFHETFLCVLPLGKTFTMNPSYMLDRTRSWAGPVGTHRKIMVSKQTLYQKKNIFQQSKDFNKIPSACIILGSTVYF